MKFTSHLYQNKGVVLHYITLGSKKNPTLLFLHGAGAKSTTYAESLLILSKHFYVISPDIPCFGQSSVPPASWTLKEFAQFFDDFLEKMDQKGVYVVGHSLGGGIALNLASISSRISKVVATNSAGWSITITKAKFFYNFYIKTTYVEWIKIRNYPILNVC